MSADQNRDEKQLGAEGKKDSSEWNRSIAKQGVTDRGPASCVCKRIAAVRPRYLFER